MLMVEVVVVEEEVDGGGERVVVKVFSWEVNDFKTGRIGVDDVGVVVDRPRLVSRAVRRSERPTRDVNVDRRVEVSLGSGGANW